MKSNPTAANKTCVNFPQCNVWSWFNISAGNGINITSLNEQVQQQKNEIEQLKQGKIILYSSYSHCILIIEGRI